MPGFSDSISDGQNLVFADNGDFSGGNLQANGLLTNGKLWIGSTALNAGGTHINVGSVTSPLGTISVGYTSPNITIDTMGGAAAIEKINVQTGTSPIVPLVGIITMNGAVVAAGTNPVRTDGTGANTLAIEVQTSQALAAADATKIGLSNFDSAKFSVSATGFVTLLAGDDLHLPKFIVGDITNGANYSTIAAAIAAASSGDTIGIQDHAAYTENLTLKSGVNFAALSAYGGSGSTVKIIGKIIDNGVTCNNTFTNISFQTNSDNILALTGGASSIVMEGCNLNATNATAMTIATGCSVSLEHCSGNLGTTGIAWITGAGSSQFAYSEFTNSGSSVTASTVSGSSILMRYSVFNSPFSTSSTGFINSSFSLIDCSAINSTAVTTAGSGESTFNDCFIDGGSASAISVGSGTTVDLYEGIIGSTNTNCITGSGNISLSGVTYKKSSSLVNTTTQTLTKTNKGAYKVTLPAGDYTVLTTDEIVGATSSAARAITLNSSPSTGQVVTIKDVTGTAAANNITITPAAGNIDGAGTKVIASNYGSVTLFYSGMAWFSI